MSETPKTNPQKLSRNDLERVLVRAKAEGWTELALIGRWADRVRKRGIRVRDSNRNPTIAPIAMYNENINAKTPRCEGAKVQ